MSQSLRSLTKYEQMSESLVFIEGIAHLLTFSQKTSDSLRKPMSEFPTLVLFHSLRLIQYTYLHIQKETPQREA